MIVSQAITEVLNKHQVPVLYTSRGEFENVVGATRGFCQMGASLWDASPDGLRDLANDYKAGQVVPFKPYGGWSSRVGKQFWFHLVPPSSVEGDSDIFNATWLESPTAPVCQ
jgi:hypothetical protein